jgi:hypothetical protein
MRIASLVPSCEKNLMNIDKLGIYQTFAGTGGVVLLMRRYTALQQN